MALNVTTLKRVFSLKKNNADIELADPNKDWSPEEVLNFYANTYPELTNANIHGPEVKDDQVVFEFKATVGVKG